MNIHSTIEYSNFTFNTEGSIDGVKEKLYEVSRDFSKELQDKIAITDEDKKFIMNVSGSNIKHQSKSHINDIIEISRAYHSIKQSNEPTSGSVDPMFNDLRTLLEKQLGYSTYKIRLESYYDRKDRQIFYDLVNNYIYDKLPFTYDLIISKRYKGVHYHHELRENLNYYPKESFCYSYHMMLGEKIIMCYCIGHLLGCGSEYYIRSSSGKYALGHGGEFMNEDGDYVNNNE